MKVLNKSLRLWDLAFVPPSLALVFVHIRCPKFLFMLPTFSPYLSLENFPQLKQKTAAGRQVLSVLLIICLHCLEWLLAYGTCLISLVQSLSCIWLFVTPWTAAHQASSLSITNSWSLLRLMSIELMMPSNHLILCCPLLILPSIFPSIRIFFQWVGSSHKVTRVLEL